MGLFMKKPKPEEQKPNPVLSYNYNAWEQDFGFLTLCISRKTSMIKNYVIKVFAGNLDLAKTSGSASQFIHDSDIMDIYEHTVKDIMACLSDNYIQFMIAKYFKNEDQLVKFVSESVYVEIINSAIEANQNRIKNEYLAEFDKQVQKLNQSVQI